MPTLSRDWTGVIVLVSGATVEVRKASEHVGVLVVPGAWAHPETLDLHRPWAMDNGAFSGLDVSAFLRMLRRFKGYTGCLFVTSPDVVADAKATMDLFDEWEPLLHSLGWPVAFVGQDGLRIQDVPWKRCEAVFLGGSTEWKLGPVARDLAAYGKAYGKWVHMGRVNSAKRMKYAMRIGCDSVDGKQWSAWSRRYLPKVSGIVQSWHGGPLLGEG